MNGRNCCGLKGMRAHDEPTNHGPFGTTISCKVPVSLFRILISIFYRKNINKNINKIVNFPIKIFIQRKQIKINYF